MSNNNLRLEYERRVLALCLKGPTMRAQGLSEEAIARTLHAERRSLAAEFKDDTPEPLRTQLRQWTLARYGDPMGPTIEHLRRVGKSWAEIIDSASRPGRPPSASNLATARKGSGRD